MTELEEGSFWAGFSPYCLKSALPPENSPTLRDSNLRLRWIRIYWWVLLLLVYSALLLESNANRELSSAVRYEVMEQLFPDWNKAAERTRDAEISPSLKELLTADDVAKTMSFYTDICASQSSISASMKATWECKLFDIRVENPEGGSWDPTTNHALPDVDKDTLMNGTRGILETKARTNKTNKELAKERRYEIKQICSENFFQTHFIIGDDPRKVPLGDVNAFAQRVRQVHPGLNPVFDQFLLHDQGFGGMKQMLNEIKEEVKEIKESQKELDHDGGRRLSTRLQRRSPWLLDVDLESNRSEEVPAKPAEALEAKATNATAAAQGLTFPANHSGINGSVAKDQNFPSGCFDPGDVAGLLRDLWVSYAGSDDTEWGLNEEDAKGMAKEVLPNVGSDTWPQYWEEMNPDGDLKLSGEEFLVFAEKHLKEFQWPIRGYLNSECRNHHFSLISLCKPQEISAHYQVAFVPGKKNSAGIFFTQQRINVLLSFKQVTDQSGWYRTNLRIFNKSCIGSKTPGTVILMVLTLILFSFLTLIDSLATLILLPLNLYRILWMDLPSDASIEEIETCFWRKFLQGLDARGVASRFLPVLIVLAERLLALGFILSCVEAVKESRMNTVLPFGVLSESCMVTWFRGNKGWIIGRNVPRGINMINYINECTDVAGVDYLAELFFEVLFEDEGCFHALVVGLIMLRILEAFSLSSRLNWLPRTLFLSKNKLQNFLLAYVCLVAGFSLIMTLYFGDIFQQFSSLQESFCTLLLYSFGSTERALYGSKPFIEVGSSHLHAALFFYTVFAVTIILNMFTTIVIDAFTAEGDPERYEKIYKEETQSLTSQLLQVFGKGHLLNKKSQLTRQASSEEDKAET